MLRNQGKKRAAKSAAVSDPQQVQRRAIEQNRGKAAFFNRHFRSSSSDHPDEAEKATFQAEDLAKTDSNEGEDQGQAITISHPVLDREGGAPITITADLDYDEGEAMKSKGSDAEC